MSEPLRIEIASKLRFFLGAKARYKVAHGGRGSAKSVSAGRSLIARCMSEKTRWLCAREYMASMKESVHSLLVGEIDTLGLGKHFQVMRDCIKGPHNSEIVYVGLHDQSLDSLKSYYGFDGCWIEEGQSISRRSWQYLDPTIRKDGSEIWVTMNPENVDDVIYHDFIANVWPDSIVQQVNWYDNPWLPEVLRKQKDQAYLHDPEAANWIWGGQCRSVSDAQILRGRWRIQPFEPKSHWDGPYQGADWGFGDDPSVMVRIWIDGRTLYVEHEAYKHGAEIDYLPALFDSIEGSREPLTRADSSRPETISAVRRAGFNIIAAEKWPGSVDDGVEYLRSFDSIVIHPRCPRTAEEAKLYSYKKDKRSGDVIKPPIIVDLHNHCMDAIRYALTPMIRGYSKDKPVTKPEYDDYGLPIGFGGVSGSAGWMV